MIAEGLIVRYQDGTVAVDDFDLVVRDGDFVCLRGPSGAGKSTLLGAMAGELLPSGGRLRLGGGDPGRWGSKQRVAWRRSVGFAAQDMAMLERRSAIENVAYADRVRRGSGRQAAMAAAGAVLARLGLDGKEGNLPGELSGGERQRVVLAQATIANPALVIADEPTSNLDPASAAMVAAHLWWCHMAGAAVVVATHHHPELFERRANQCLWLDAGRMVERRS